MPMTTRESRTQAVRRSSIANQVLFFLNSIELFISMKDDSIFEVNQPEEEPKEEDENAEISGKIYEKMADDELYNANRHVIEMKA